MKVSTANVCLNCDEVYEANGFHVDTDGIRRREECPHCQSRHYYPLRKWLNRGPDADKIVIGGSIHAVSDADCSLRVVAGKKPDHRLLVVAGTGPGRTGHDRRDKEVCACVEARHQ